MLQCKKLLLNRFNITLLMKSCQHNFYVLKFFFTNDSVNFFSK